jgi:hypothetical protein
MHVNLLQHVSQISCPVMKGWHGDSVWEYGYYEVRYNSVREV